MDSRLILTGEAAALLELVTKSNDLISVSVKARLTPNESSEAVRLLKEKDLVVIEKDCISLTKFGREIKASMAYDVKGKVGSIRIYPAGGFSDSDGSNAQRE
jgi:predicted methyltransferase